MFISVAINSYLYCALCHHQVFVYIYNLFAFIYKSNENAEQH